MLNFLDESRPFGPIISYASTSLYNACDGRLRKSSVSLSTECCFWFSDLLKPSNIPSTSYMVGLSSLLNWRHVSASIAIAISFSSVPSSLTLLSKSWKSWFSLLAKRRQLRRFISSGHLADEIGFSPVKSSTRITPKLYTSLFSVNWLAWLLRI